MTCEQWINLVTGIVPLLVFLIGIIFKWNQQKREELSHALEYALGKLRAGLIETDRAEEIILSTGAVSEAKVKAVIDEMMKRQAPAPRTPAEETTDYQNNVIPGVGLKIDSSGNFEVYPLGLLNKAAHKVGKWLKKKI
jgi:energy-converting hydrogenase Eha subunit G